MRTAPLGILGEATGRDLSLAVGMRNLLVHEYLTAYQDKVRAAALAAPALLSVFRRSVAAWLVRHL
ncbi:hypothetical protein ACQBAT_05455 [Ornithinimicrobium sp. Y1847]|uniref:hypothetical protein n=1 Tax=unclassified Ornithinimicrobium TaxID=2615080 RepID=UPI003B67F4D9